jgi:phage terminase small subunit
MKKIMMVSLMLTIAMALQAQVKVAPKMEKGTVKTYVAEATITLPGQGDVKVTADSKYSITDAKADSYVLEMVSTDVKTECEPGNIAGKLVAAAQEMMKDAVVRATLDKDGRIQNILNGDEVKAKINAQADIFIDKMMADMPQLAGVVSKDALKQQLSQSLTVEGLVQTMQESTSPLALNGKTITSGSQEEFVSKEGIKMKRMYFVNGKTIIANSVMNMTEEEMKQTIIKQVEKSAPDQAQMIKDNIDQLMSTGMLKMDSKETATYELQDDGWVKSIVVDSTIETMGQKVVSKSIIKLK